MLRQFLSELADKFREVLGTTAMINAQDFPDKISEVYESGRMAMVHKLGKNSGEFIGTFSETNAVFPWSQGEFKLKYPVNATGDLYKMFFRFNYNQAVPVDLAEFFKRHSITINTQYNCEKIFYQARISRLPEIRLGPAKHAFGGCSRLETIEGLQLRGSTDVAEDVYAGAFSGCSNLKNIRFIGPVRNKLVLLACVNLTVESVLSLFNALADYSNDVIASTHARIRIHASVKAKLSDEQIAIATSKGWTITT